MTEQAIKDEINKSTLRSCLPGARIVYCRHAAEEYQIQSNESVWGGVCPCIHPDVTLKEFFK